MPTYNKLVRDKILEIIEADNLTYNAKSLDEIELLIEVKKKMIEEAHEFNEARNNKEAVEELADILELVYTAVGSLNITLDELEKVREQKKEKRGGFDKAIFLIDVQDK